MSFGYPRTLIIFWALFYLYQKLVFWIYWKLYSFLDLIISQKQWPLVSLSLECIESNAHNRYCSTSATSIHKLLSPEHLMFFCTSSRHIRVSLTTQPRFRPSFVFGGRHLPTSLLDGMVTKLCVYSTIPRAYGETLLTTWLLWQSAMNIIVVNEMSLVPLTADEALSLYPQYRFLWN